MKKGILLFALAISIFGCTQNNNKAAFDELNRAKELYESKEFSSAKNILDSLKTAYPDNVELQRARLDLSQEIEYAEALRNINYVDSMIPIKEAELEDMLPLFRLEKNDEYENLGRYVDKAYNPSLDTHSQFVKVTVNEEGDISLVSAYSGGAIKHTQIKVSEPSGSYAETEIIPQDGGMNYSFKDINGKTYETITFQKGKDNGVIMFIYNYGDENLSLERLGGKKVNPLTISTTEKQSIKRLTELSMTIKEINELKKEKIKNEKRIEYLRSKLS